MQVDGSGLQVGMPEQSLVPSADRPRLPPDAWQNCAEARCGRTALVMPALCAASRQASHSTLGVIGLSARKPLTVAGKQDTSSASSSASIHARSRAVSDSAAHARSWRFLPCRIWMSMRSLSISSTLRLAHLGSAHAGRVDRHQHGAMKQVAGRVDQPDRFFLRQDGRQATWRLFGYGTSSTG